MDSLGCWLFRGREASGPDMSPLIMLHVAGGSVALVSGLGAVIARKGSAQHKQCGYVFLCAMLLMAVTAGIGSLALAKPFDVLSSLMTCYLVCSGATAFRLDHNKLHMKRLHFLFMLVAALCVTGYVGLELNTYYTGMRATDAPVGAGYIFGLVLLVGLLGDLRVRLRVLSGRQKRLRHIWRICLAFFLATANIFGVRPHLFPEWLQISGVLAILAFGPLFLMLYWQVVTLRKT